MSMSMSIHNRKQLSQATVEPFDASTCKSNGLVLDTVMSSVQKCTSATELQQQSNLGSSMKIKQDLETIRGVITDSLTVGDSMFGQAGHATLTHDVKERNKELHAKKDTVMHDIDHNEAVINRSNRDFLDVKETLPETQPQKILHFIEDYTLALLSMAYLFLMIICIYFYVYLKQGSIITALGQSLGVSTIITLIAFMLLYYLS